MNAAVAAHAVVAPAKFYQPGDKEFAQFHWAARPYGEKDWSHHDGDYIATVIVYPQHKVNKKGEPVIEFIPVGVRIENIRSRSRRNNYVLPGQHWFVYRRGGETFISRHGGDSFATNRAGGLEFANQFPVVIPGARIGKSVKLTRHPKGEFFARLSDLAWESYAAHRAACLAAARG